MYSTNSVIPPSYLCTNSFDFFNELSLSVIEIPLFKKANSLILLSKIFELNLIDENISLDGKKEMLVPLFFVFPICFKGLIELPFSNLISYSLPSL